MLKHEAQRKRGRVGSMQAGMPDTMTRILYTLEIIGRAHLRGGLYVSEALPFGQQCEVGVALDELAHFASLIDINKTDRK